MDTNTAWETLQDFAEGRIEHINAGSCPDCIEGFGQRDIQCPVCRALDAIAGPAPAAVASQGEWRIDTSTGRGILVYQNCSVIEAEQAPYVLGLIAADAAAAHAPALEAPAAPQQGLAIPDDCPHIIWFDDHEMQPVMFAGHGARAAALEKFKRISLQWNAHLFVRIDRNSRDDRFSVAALAAAPQAPAAPAVDAARPKVPLCTECGADLKRVVQCANSYLSAEQFDADKLGDWFCECCPQGPSQGSRKHRYFWNAAIAAQAKEGGEA